MESIYRPRTAGSRLDPGQILRDLRSGGRKAARLAIITFRQDPVWALWLLAWLPFWIGSVAPPPRLSWRRPDTPAAPLDQPAGAHLTARIDRLTRTFGTSWFIGSMCRGLAIGLAAITTWAAIAAVTSLTPPSLPTAVVIVLVGLAIGAVYGWLIWPSRAQTLRMLDQTFSLRERMVSAFERSHAPSRISRIQLADAANKFDEIAPEIPRSSWIPVREVVLCLLLAGALITIILMGMSSRQVAALNPAPVPQFLLASERMAVREQPVQSPPVSEAPTDNQASIADIQERGRTSQQAREDLDTLGEALEPHAITKPAADAIANENYDEGASLLRNAAESASTMDQAEREAMADDLDQAADQMSDQNPALSQATRDAANALREGGPSAEDALSSLANEVEASGDKVESQESISQELDQATGANRSTANQNQSESPGEGNQEGDTQQANQSTGNEQSGTQPGSDPGEGAEANPGVVNQQESNDANAASSQQSGESSEPGSGSAASDEGSGNSPAEQGDATNGQASNASQSEGSSGQQSSTTGTEGDPSQASQGGGSGSSKTSNQESSDDSQSASSGNSPQEKPEDAEEPGVGKAGDPPEGDGQGDDNTGTGATSSGNTSLQLQGTSDQSVQSGGSSGTASTGSGSDSTTASGDLPANNPGEAGPDSNRVPASLRDIVREYFDWPLP